MPSIGVKSHWLELSARVWMGQRFKKVRGIFFTLPKTTISKLLYQIQENGFVSFVRPLVLLVSLTTVEAYTVPMLPDGLVQPFRGGILRGTALKRPMAMWGDCISRRRRNI